MNIAVYNNSFITGGINMSIFLTRPVINTKEERNAKADILELINFERFCRDNAQWDEMRKCFAKDSFVNIS